MELCTSTSRITGKERDAESGFDYFGARHYGATSGRFTSSDPGPYQGGDPQTLNRYSYTRNSPIRLIDPNGRYFVVAADLRSDVQHYFATMLRTNEGKQLIFRAAMDPRPVRIMSGTLPYERVGHDARYHTGTTTAVTKGGPGQITGIDIVLDKSRINNATNATGESFRFQGTVAMAEELYHTRTALNATSLQAAQALMVPQDQYPYEAQEAGKAIAKGGTANKGMSENLAEALAGLMMNYRPPETKSSDVKDEIEQDFREGDGGGHLVPGSTNGFDPLEKNRL